MGPPSDDEKQNMSTLLLLVCSALSVRALVPVTGGSMVALPTPMVADGKLDMGALRSQIEWHVECGTEGIVALGTTGEASTMNDSERDEVLSTVIKAADGRIPVIAGTGTIDPVKTIKMGLRAKELGCDATLVVTPYYVKPTQPGLIAHFGAVADAVDLPMILYNVPGRTGVDMLPETVAELAAMYPGIIGVKEATGDLSRVATLRKSCGDEFLLLSGDDGTGLQFCVEGGDGVISVTAAIAPSEMQGMIEAAQIDVDTARVLDASLRGLHSHLFCQANPIPVKWALARAGKTQPGIRLPLLELEPQYHAALEDAMRAAGIKLP